MKEVLIGALAFATFAVAGAQADASRNCADRDDVLARLAEGYGEVRQSIGIGANNSIVEVFASSETGTWTITVTNHSGLTCLVATGQAFEETHEVLETAKDDA